MKWGPIGCFMLIIATPAAAAPPEIEDLCWAMAERVHFNGRGEREAFIANCIADYTPPLPIRRPDKKPRS
jgi:hypothetical protein